MRLFLAISLPSGLRRELGAFIRERSREAGPVRWCRQENLHLTLHFFGQLPQSDISRIDAALAGPVSRCPVFAFSVAGLGAFPNFRRPAVLWAGVTAGSAALAALHGVVRMALGTADFPASAYGFRPHITLGRVRRGRRLSRQTIERIRAGTAEREFGAAPVRVLSLYRSAPTRDGPVYTEIARWPLDRSPDAGSA